MIGMWWGGGVWMVVELGFGFVHGGERERERERERLKSDTGEILFWDIYFIT